MNNFQGFSKPPSPSLDLNLEPPKRRNSSDSLILQIGKHLDLVGKALSEPQSPPSIADPFLEYLGKTLSDVPPEKRRKCEQSLLCVAHAYADVQGETLQILYEQS